MAVSADAPFVYFVLVNYKGWADTLACLESVFRSDYPHFAVLVCDNHSRNGSLAYIKEWALGEREAEVDTTPTGLLGLVRPQVTKPLPVQELAAEEAGEPGPPVAPGTLVLIQSLQNRGFAGGNNVGIRFAQTRGEFAYLWFLNCDTVVEPDALRQLIAYAGDRKAAGIKTGIIGATLRYYHQPERLQAIGGKYSKWLGTTRHLGAEEKDQGQYLAFDPAGMDYVVGASMLVSKAFLEEVGPMAEQYFLYFEELDWALRGREKGWQLGFCPTCRVYHKEGGSTGSGSKNQKSEFSDLYSLKNRVVLTRSFFPAYLPFVYLGFGGVFVNRIRRGQFGRALRIIKMLVRGEVTG
ncbi:glycosyltransferase family 2 protein [soil metagenome]